MPSCAAGANSRDLTFRVEHTSDGVTFHGALNSYAWVRHGCMLAVRLHPYRPTPDSDPNPNPNPPLTQRPSLRQVLLVINYLQTRRTPVLPQLDPLTLHVTPQKLVDRRPQKPVDAEPSSMRFSLKVDDDNRICSDCGKAFNVCHPAC